MFIAQSIGTASGTSVVTTLVQAEPATATASGSSTTAATSFARVHTASTVGQSSALAIGVGYIPQKPKPVTIYAVPQVVNLVYPEQ